MATNRTPSPGDDALGSVPAEAGTDSEDLVRIRLREMTAFAGKIIRRNRLKFLMEAEDMAMLAVLDLWRRISRDSKAVTLESPELAGLAMAIVKRTILSEVRRARAVKRNGSMGTTSTVGVSGKLAVPITGSAPTRSMPHGQDFDALVQQLPECSSPPEDVAILRDEIQSLGNRLGEPEVARILEMKLKGFSIPEIASEIGRSISSLERTLRRLRELLR